MKPQLVVRNDGRWHIEILPEGDNETRLFQTLAAKELTVQFTGSVLNIEVADYEDATNGTCVDARLERGGE